MKTILKVVSIIAIVLGGLAIFESLFGEGSMYGFLGGGLFFIQGVFALIYIKEVENSKGRKK